MAAPNYSGLIAAIEAILRDDPTLDERSVHVTQEPIDPTPEQCPCVQVTLLRFDRRPRRMVGMAYGAGGFDEDLAIGIRCTAFSAESAADAQRQRDDLVALVHEALGTQPTLGGLVQYAYVTGGTPTGRADEGSIYAAMDLTMTARVAS